MDGEGELERLFRAEYVRLVRALAVAHGDAEAAADAVQDAFVQASRHWARVRSYDSPATWVRRVAINRLANHARGRRRRDRALGRLRPLATDPPSPERLDVREAVAGLAPRQRVAVCLYYLSDLPVAEVAASMGLGEGTVKAHLAAARQALSQRLEVPDG